jgi:hypothetical protein
MINKEFTKNDKINKSDDDLTSIFIPENVERLIVRISSTTIITVALTYVIFFVL